MREMKDSGVAWIGEIPKDWEVGKVKHYYKIQTGFTPDTKNESYYDDDGIDWVTIADLSGERNVPDSTNKKVSSAYIDVFHPQLTPTGSLLYSFKLSVGQVAFTTRPVYTNEAIVSFLPDNSLCLDFLFYSSTLIIENANTNIYGAKLLNQELIKNAFIVYPPVNTQKAISLWLDKKNSKVDDLISNNEAQIEKLKQYKQSLISEVVTKGLDPTVPMKDSGDEWIGKIPEHWKLVPSKRIFADIKEKRRDGDIQMASTQKYGIISQEKYMELENCRIVLADKGIENWKHVEPNDFVISLRSFQGGLEFCEKSGCVTWHYIVLRAKCIVSFRYFRWLFKCKTYIQALQHTCNYIRDGQDLRYSNFIQVPLCIPSINEQDSIANYLDTKCTQIDRLIAIKQAKIEKLNQYKKSLIYEYVTGKKEV